MADWGSTLQGSKNLVLQEGTAFAAAGTTETGILTKYSTLSATGTAAMTTMVPALGAELIAASFTVISPGSVTTSGNMAMAISDGTSELALNATGDATTAAGGIITLTPQSVANGKAVTAAAAGTRLILVNTETGTIGDGMHGIFRLVWAL